MNPNLVIPDLSEGFAVAESERPVFLDGMKILLDRKVPLVPVELEEQPEDRNGSGPSFRPGGR